MVGKLNKEYEKLAESNKISSRKTRESIVEKQSEFKEIKEERRKQFETIRK